VQLRSQSAVMTGIGLEARRGGIDGGAQQAHDNLSWTQGLKPRLRRNLQAALRRRARFI
jgi:hypothetical protein